MGQVPDFWLSAVPDGSKAQPGGKWHPEQLHQGPSIVPVPKSHWHGQEQSGRFGKAGLVTVLPVRH